MKEEGEDEGEGNTGKKRGPRKKRKGVQKIGSARKGTKLKMC